MKKNEWFIALAAGAGVAALTYNLLSNDIPDGATAVEPFDMDKYLGTWNEVARLPNMFEKGITKLSEEYLTNGNGTFKVITKAYNSEKDKWSEFSGKIKFAGEPNQGKLKVSYFGPAYLSYNVLDVDTDYKYALVSGSGFGYLWILSREKDVPDFIKVRFLTLARAIGFDVDKLEWL